MIFLRKSGPLEAFWIKSLATTARCSFCSGSRGHGTNFAMTCFMPRSCVKILDTVVFGIPRSASISCTVSCQSLLIAAHTHSTFSGVLFVAGLPEHGSLRTDSWPCLKCLCHVCTALTASSPKAFWIFQMLSAEECSSLMQNLMQIRCSAHWVILNVMTTQYTCPLNSIYRPHWLVMLSHHCSHMYIPVHSPWLPGYIDVVQTILVILTMAGLFLDRLSYVPSIPTLLGVFIINGCWISIRCFFFTSIDRIMWFLSFILFMWYITFIDL